LTNIVVSPNFNNDEFIKSIFSMILPETN